MIAAGLHGIDNELELEPAFEGNAYESDKPHVPRNLYDARDLFAESDVAREAFGQEVVDHYLNRARVELEASRGRRHRLGALPRVREAVSMPAGDRHLRRRRARTLGVVGPGDRRSRRVGYATRRAAGGRAGAAPAARPAAEAAEPSSSSTSTRCCSPAAPTWIPATYGAEAAPRDHRAHGPSATRSRSRSRRRPSSAACRCSGSAAACRC